MNLRFIDWIWRVRGSLPLSPELSTDRTFERLDVLFQVPGTTYTRDRGKLIFRKKNQPAQDKMSIFDSGTLSVEDYGKGRRLNYNLLSRTLLLCFLAPALFFVFAKIFEFTRDHQKLTHTATVLHANSATTATDGKANATLKKNAIVPMSPIDKFLGVPEPDKKDPSKDDDEEKAKKKFSSTPAYVFCGLFSFLYVVGRILENYLIKREIVKAISILPIILFVFY
ncbi:hypothetical protein AAC691_00460 [Nguyenibacter vanlangensis]|uniref:Uncharacterized protein n=1 Tax=Nguyenibacter vanlangensis TaxID=1216886 RepID=A0ABZ3D608_9PROT